MFEYIIQQQCGNVLSEGMKKLVSMLLGKATTFSEIVSSTNDMVLNLGCNLVSSLLEMADSALASSPGVKSYFRRKTRRSRTIMTEMGPVNFVRSYYINKKTGKYCFLLDALLGIEKYRRVDPKFRVYLCKLAAEHSYQNACNICHNAVSKTSVMNFLREFKSYFEDGIAVERKKGEMPKVLYIEADEDHVTYQNGDKHFEKMVYVHEGYEQVDKNHRALINPHCFIGSYAQAGGNEELWDRLISYIRERYGDDAMSKIKLYFTSDAGRWLRTSSDWIDEIQVLDKYHVSQACKRAVGGGFKWNSRNCLKEWVLTGDWQMVKTFKTVYLSDPMIGTSRRKKATKAFNYLLNNREYIDNIRFGDYHGDSTEAHISHWLASRDSSRPYSWSQEGLDSVMFFRCCKINKVNVYAEYCRKYKEERKKERAVKIDQRVNSKAKLNAKYLDTAHHVASNNLGVQVIFDAIENATMINA